MQLNNTKESREIKTEYLKIHGNCMEFKDTIIQLSSVSLVSTEKLALTPLPIWTVVLILIGLSVLFTKISNLTFVGIILIICGAVGVFLWYRQNEKTKQLERLLITTNSGHTYTITFSDAKFLSKVLRTLKEIISNPGHLSDVTISIKDNTFRGGSSIIRDYREVFF